MDLQTYLTLDATEMAKLIHQKEIKPEELIALSFEQLDKVNPSLNMVTRVFREKVLEEVEDSLAVTGAFSGVPMYLKNSGQTIKGEGASSGSRLLASNVAARDSNFVTRLRKAGLLFTGQTNAPEFGLKNITEPELHGPTRNPWNKDYSPGGSSGGSAAIVASGVVPVAGASDGGGSIRIPASFTSLFGLKPTRGRTPVGPGVGRQWQGAAIDFVVSRSVRDSAGMLDVLQVIQPAAAFQVPLFEDKYTNVLENDFKKPLKIAFTTKSPVGTPVSEDAKLAVEKTVKWLEKEGHIVEEKDNGVDGLQLIKDYYLMNSGEIASLMQKLERSFGRTLTAADVEIETLMLNEAGKSLSAADFSASLASWDTAAEQMATLHQTYDFYITPATASTAPKIGELSHTKTAQESMLSQVTGVSSNKQQELIYEMFLPSLTYTPFSQLANLTGQPAMTVPVHFSAAGLPLGVQVMAQKGEEHRLLQLAHQLEQSDLWVGMKGNPLF